MYVVQSVDDVMLM